MFKIINETQGIIIAERCVAAFSFFRRVTGLLNHASLNYNEALLISPAKTIHVSGMKFPIDIIFLDKNFCVVNLFENIKPNLMKTKILPKGIKGGKGAIMCIELPAGTIKRTNTKISDKIATLKIMEA